MHTCTNLLSHICIFSTGYGSSEPLKTLVMLCYVMLCYVEIDESLFPITVLVNTRGPCNLSCGLCVYHHDYSRRVNTATACYNIVRSLLTVASLGHSLLCRSTLHINGVLEMYDSLTQSSFFVDGERETERERDRERERDSDVELSQQSPLNWPCYRTLSKSTETAMTRWRLLGCSKVNS